MDEHAPSATTANVEGGFAVFLIGMRINAWWRPDLWLPVLLSMGRMVRELRAHPEFGLLGVAPTGFSNPILLVQYWKSADHLLRFASQRDAQHLPAWSDYNRRVRSTRAVGVWHETYVVEAGLRARRRVRRATRHRPPSHRGRPTERPAALRVSDHVHVGAPRVGGLTPGG
jgi:hypothetical protein